MKKGLVHILPVFLVAAALILGAVGVTATQRTHDLQSQVLSSSDQNRGSSQNSSNSDRGPENRGRGSLNSQSTNSNSSSKSRSSEGGDRKSGPNVETGRGGDKTKVDKKNRTLETEQETENESSPGATSSARPGLKIRTNFPITVNPLTNEKIVTTPSGVHIVILPEVAIRNMIKAGFPVVLPPEPSPTPEATASATPGGTSSAAPSASPSLTTTQGGILLTELNNQLVYEIPAIKKQNFLGFVPVDVKVRGYVSAESGNIVTLKKSLFDQLLDLLSF